MRNALIGALVAWLASLGCSSDPVPPKLFGEPCVSDEECESGICQANAAGDFCSAACAVLCECPAGYICVAGNTCDIDSLGTVCP